jgi:hypothetical protein
MASNTVPHVDILSAADAAPSASTTPLASPENDLTGTVLSETPTSTNQPTEQIEVLRPADPLETALALRRNGKAEFPIHHRCPL